MQHITTKCGWKVPTISTNDSKLGDVRVYFCCGPRCAAGSGPRDRPCPSSAARTAAAPCPPASAPLQQRMRNQRYSHVNISCDSWERRDSSYELQIVLVRAWWDSLYWGRPIVIFLLIYTPYCGILLGNIFLTSRVAINGRTCNCVIDCPSFESFHSRTKAAQYHPLPVDCNKMVNNCWWTQQLLQSYHNVLNSRCIRQKMKIKKKFTERLL